MLRSTTDGMFRSRTTLIAAIPRAFVGRLQSGVCCSGFEHALFVDAFVFGIYDDSVVAILRQGRFRGCFEYFERDKERKVHHATGHAFRLTCWWNMRNIFDVLAIVDPM